MLPHNPNPNPNPWSFFYLTICPAIFLLTICFVPNFATVDGHNRGFNNLLCGEPTLESQENVNLSDCSIEVRAVKVLLPLATLFQLFAVIQGLASFKLHALKGNDTNSNNNDDTFFFFSDHTFSFYSYIFLLAAGLTYATNMTDMNYMINSGEVKYPGSFINDGVFAPLFITTLCLQGWAPYRYHRHLRKWIL